MQELHFYPEEALVPLLLHWLGILPNCRGHRYLCSAMALSMSQERLDGEICPLVAREYGVQPAAVRRGIWSAIERGRRSFPNRYELMEGIMPELPMPPLDALLFRMCGWLKVAHPLWADEGGEAQWWLRIS